LLIPFISISSPSLSPFSFKEILLLFILSCNLNKLKILNNDKTQILSLKNEQLLNYSIPYKFNELSDYSKPKIDVIF
jgi:hypothetical protein